MALISVKDPQQLSKWLADAIFVEISKPEDDIDMDFVDECQSLIDILMNAPEYTDEEIETRFNRIITKATARNNKIKPKNRFRFRFKSVLVASIIIFVFFGFSVGLFAFNPSVRNMVLSFFKAGQTVEGDGITYEYLGENKIYDSVESLIESEGLDIKFPTILPEGVRLEKVLKPEINRIVFVFSDSTFCFEIVHNSNVDASSSNYVENFKTANYDFYICYINSMYYAYSNIKDDLYVLSSTSKEVLLEVLNSFN